jgi:hypothetical protein
MTIFDFLEFFGPQTVFIGEWGMEFYFLYFFQFFCPQMVKTIKFVLKQ